MGQFIMRSKQTRMCWSKTCKQCDEMGGRLRSEWLILQTLKKFLRIANPIWDAFRSCFTSKRAVIAIVFSLDNASATQNSQRLNLIEQLLLKGRPYCRRRLRCIGVFGPEEFAFLKVYFETRLFSFCG